MKLKIIIVIIALAMLNGLNNLREITNLAIVSSIGIGLTEDNNFIVTVQVLDAQKGEGGSGSSSDGGTSIVTYEQTASTIQEAVRRVILECPDKLYLSHMELLIISERVAKERFADAVDFFVRDYEGSNRFILAVSNGCEPKDILDITTPLEKIPSTNIVKSIESTYKYYGTSTDKKFIQAMSEILEDGDEMVVPSIGVDGDLEESSKSDNVEEFEPKAKIIIENMAYFKDKKLAGFLAKDDNICYNLLKGELSDTIIEAESTDTFVAEVLKNSVKLTPKVKNGEYIVDVKVKMTCNITEVGEKIEKIDESNIEDYEKILGEQLKTKIEKYIDNCQNKYECDIVGLSELYRKKLNKEYKKVENNFYTDIYKNIKANVEVNVTIPSDGGIKKKW